MLGVQLDGASCATFLDDAQPHLLRMQGVKPVRLGSKQGRRLVLLSETLQDVYTTFPPDLQAQAQVPLVFLQFLVLVRIIF